MKLNQRSPRSSRIKFALLITAFVIIASILLYTKNLVDILQTRESQTASLFAKSLEYVANSSTTGGDYSFIFEEIISVIDFPMIETDAKNNFVKSFRNIKIDSTKSTLEQQNFLLSISKQMDELNKPIVVAFQDSIILSEIHYGESETVTRLRWFPFIEIAIVTLFILIAYISFSYIKRSEQSNIWVGMARETAHQLGTPISSIMGWIEILLMKSENDSETNKTVLEMEKDLARLKKISDRFSKIGSKPELKKESANEVINRAIDYFSARTPHLGKKVEFIFEPKNNFEILINRELFEWVLENLIRNALDSMESGVGKIKIEITDENNFVNVDLTDSGKGIVASMKKDVFRPGFSTKQRGWGLGLSLAKRIVEIYHGGKLFVKESTLGVGTTFRIKIPK